MYPINVGAIAVAPAGPEAITLVTTRFSLNKTTCKFKVQEIKWVRTELYKKPEILFVK